MQPIKLDLSGCVVDIPAVVVPTVAVHETIETKLICSHLGSSVDIETTTYSDRIAMAGATSIDPEIIQAIASPESMGEIVGASKFIVGRLMSAGLAREMVLPPSQLGMHPCNRSKYGAHEDSVHQLASEIFEVGWDSEKLRGAICVEDSPDGYIEDYNMSLTKSSELLAPVEKNTIVAGTLTNGHTVLMLKGVVAGVRSSAAGVCIDGRMNLAVVAATRPEMARAAVEGWRWTVLTRACKDLYGDPLFELLSGVEHDLEVLLKVWRHATQYTIEKKATDWGEISKSTMRTKPECSEYLPSMIKFVQLFGGGIESTSLSCVTSIADAC